MERVGKRFNNKARSISGKTKFNEEKWLRSIKREKKQRKDLIKVLDRKKKRLNRDTLFQKLRLVQAKSEEIPFLLSTSNMQTLGIKRCFKSKVDSGKKRLKVTETYSSSAESSEDEQNTEIWAPPKDTEEQYCKSKEVLKEVKVTRNVSEKNIEKEKTPAVFIPLNRLPEIQAAREALPIFGEEQAIVEAIRENPVVIIHGETGCGKTTQVPQFLYEAGFTQGGRMIGITEPRRIAAITMSSRVAKEMNAPEKVSYQIRYEKTVQKNTEIKFMTDGVLLQEMRHDLSLSKYSVVVIDEAHERSCNTDLLIGILSRIIKKREKMKDPLKLIIMSATMRVEDFRDNNNLFNIQPLLIQVESRQHSVQVHFNVQTPVDYVEAAYNKVCKIHNQLPPGAILVFLTGEVEVQRLCKMLRQSFPSQAKPKRKCGVQQVLQQKRLKKRKVVDASFDDLNIDLDNFEVEPLNTENLQHQMSDEESEKITYFEENSNKCEFPLHTLPLYAALPFEEQEKVFIPPPTGSRLCVVSTNVAETSITIPGLKYVVDSGKVKTKVYNGGVSKFEICWCSKASANQRAGRCGRTEGGHCYRLYSSSVFENDFPSYTLPEIQRTPVDDVLLYLKALGFNRVIDFPFPSPPDKESLKQAEKRLVLLGALQDLQEGRGMQNLEECDFSAKVTQLGKTMSLLPLSPRFAKMLLLSLKHNCVAHVVAIVSALTVKDLFVNSTVTDEGKLVQEGVQKIGPGSGKSQLLGDVMVLLRAVASFEESKHKTNFCFKNGIRAKAMIEIHKMSLQLLRIMNRVFPDAQVPLSLNIPTLNDELVDKIRKIVAASLIDHTARRLPREITKDEKSLKNAYKCLECDEAVFIHPASTMFQRLPEFVVYSEIVQSTKLYMKGIVEIEPEWLPLFSPTLCEFSCQSEDPPPTYDSEKDTIYCSMGGRIVHWDLDFSPVVREMPSGKSKFTWFCFFFMDGQVCPLISSYKQDYTSITPSCLLKKWAEYSPRTKYLLQAFMSKEVDSRKSLKKVWKKDPKYLLREFLEWLPMAKHVEVEYQWPPKL